MKLIRDMRRHGYTRYTESLFRAMRKQKKKYNPKPYEQMTHSMERVQVDVKVVPLSCIADP